MRAVERAPRRRDQAVGRTAEEGIFDWDNARRRLAELNANAEDPNLWNDADAAQEYARRTALETRSRPSSASSRSSTTP